MRENKEQTSRFSLIHQAVEPMPRTAVLRKYTRQLRHCRALFSSRSGCRCVHPTREQDRQGACASRLLGWSKRTERGGRPRFDPFAALVQLAPPPDRWAPKPMLSYPWIDGETSFPVKLLNSLGRIPLPLFQSSFFGAWVTAGGQVSRSDDFGNCN